MDLVAHFSRARNVVDLRAGIVIFSSGEPGTNMFVIMEGTVSIVVGGKVVEIAGPGAIVGEMAILDSMFRSATVIARTNCRVISVDKVQFDILVRESPAFARHVMNVMAGRLRQMNELLARAS